MSRGSLAQAKRLPADRRQSASRKHRGPRPSPGPDEVGRFFERYAAAGPALLALLFVGLVAWSWRKWGDVFVDFGHEVYIPWQLSEGRVLYRDIAYFMGPLSQYF